MRFPAFLVSFLVFTLLFFAAATAQTYKVSGYVRSAENKEQLVGATVSVPALKTGTVTNENGFYTLDLPSGTHDLLTTFIGFETRIFTVTVVASDLTLDIQVASAHNELTEVVVEAMSLRNKLNVNQMSVEKVTSREAKLLPAIFGEVDLIKTLQLKPGVQSGGEASSGLYVRGGGPDQNLVMLDDAVVYNASHLFGFFSVFNPDAVESVELYKGGFPAQFGGRLSSVLEVKMNEGDQEKIGVNGGLGLISSRLTVEGPILKDKATFIVSGRRTYFDVFTRQLNRIYEDDKDYDPIPDYYFHDFNVKLNYKLSSKNQLSFSGYLGRDKFAFNDSDFSIGFEWGNTLGAFNWQHNFNPKLSVSTTASATGYDYQVSNEIDVFNFNLTSGIRDLTLKTDFVYTPNEKHQLQFGALATRHRFTVGRLNFESTEDENFAFGAGNDYEASEFGVYLTDDQFVNDKLSLNYGLRLSGFHNGGKTYTALEPRASAKYNLTPTVSLKGSYASMMQYIHLVSNSGAALPTDIWFPSTPLVKPQRSQQAAVGASKLLGQGKYLITNEAYYKWMHRQIDFRDGANLFINDSLEGEFLFGKGRSYGNEIYLEKIKGRTTGWIGYTLSWTYRKFDSTSKEDAINNGRWFPTRYDRRHDLSIVLLHQLRKRIHLTAAFVYGTGNAISLPVARFIYQGISGEQASVIPIYSDRNSYRMPAYHRLDLGLVWKLNPKRGNADLTFNVYNVYNRRNPYFIYFDQIESEDTGDTLGFSAKQVSLFPVIPSVTYNFKF